MIKKIIHLFRLFWLGLFFLVLSCGQSGSSSEVDFSFQEGVFSPRSQYANQCGLTSSSDTPYLAESHWIRSMSMDLYLWYNEIVDVNPVNYASSSTAVLDYFDLMKTFAVTDSGNSRDQYHWSIDTVEWEAYSQTGVSAGYGARWHVKQSTPPRDIVVSYTQPDSPATDSVVNLARGAQVISVDGVAVEDGDSAILNDGLWPNDIGEAHTFVIQDLGSTVTRSVTMTSSEVTIDPVQHNQILNSSVGYLHFTNHIAPSEAELVSAIADFSAAGVTDLILDLRYNGGGYLAIASQVAYMVAGQSNVTNKIFQELVFNDKYLNTNPVTGSALVPTPFYNTTIGLSLAEGQPLPELNLNRVFVLTGSRTCSASESLINGLRGIGIEVILIGDTTCGKPYGYYAMSNCGTTYFTIQFKGVNEVGYGDYSDGLVETCAVADDFDHALGDANESLLAAALHYIDTGSCPSLSSAVMANKKLFMDNDYTIDALLEPERYPGMIMTTLK
ncbi:peptidase [Candidatus Marinamargulisbacteria bacterium SCGC AG-414-C22]|nr:peptidase [Candidatus Marinamargulisbacteria bacterium SCGC AG-414-C22]